MNEIAASILADQSEMESRRYNFDTTWQRIAELIDPDNALFMRQQSWPGERRDQFQFDSTGQNALSMFTAAMESMLSPRTQMWHGLAPLDEALSGNRDVMLWLEKLNKRLFRARYFPRAGYVQATGEAYRSLGAYGNACTFVGDIPGQSLLYNTRWIGEVWGAADHSGRTNRVHRKFELTAAQAKQKFRGKPLPARIEKAKDHDRFEFLHCVKPRMDYDPERMDYRGMRFASYYVACGEHGGLIDEGGFRTMPYIFTMYQTAPREFYGRGPASQVLNTLNTINEQQKTMLRAGQRAVDPPLLLPEEDVLEKFSLRSGALNYGGVDSMGNARVIPLQSGSNVQIGLEMVKASQEVIEAAFFVNLFQLLRDNPRMTATEALLKAQEKGELLGPPVGRQQTLYQEPMIERELDILSQEPGFMDDMPPELAEAGGMLAVTFNAPINRLQRAQEAAGIMTTFEQLSPWAQIEPKVMRVFDPERVAKLLIEVNGAPVSVTRSDEELAAMDEQEQQQAQMAQLLEAAPVAGKTALDLSRAQQISSAGNTPGLLSGLNGG